MPASARTTRSRLSPCRRHSSATSKRLGRHRRPGWRRRPAGRRSHAPTLTAAARSRRRRHLGAARHCRSGRPRRHWTLTTSYSHGSLAAGTHDYIVNVLDTGAKDDGEDTLDLEGSEQADVFLLRSGGGVTEGMSTPVAANTPAFVALLHGSWPRCARPGERRRRAINYDENINSRLIVRSLGGDDYFAVDDNATLTTLKPAPATTRSRSARSGAPSPVADHGRRATASHDPQTTAGHLEPRRELPDLANGEHRQRPVHRLQQQGQLRSRATATTNSWSAPSPRREERHSTEADHERRRGHRPVMYNINAPVGPRRRRRLRQGGSSRHRVRRQLRDHRRRSLGAGLNVYDNMEALEVDGVEGDDHFFIQSTRAGVVTTIIGRQRQRHLRRGWRRHRSIVSLDLEGRSGVDQPCGELTTTRSTRPLAAGVASTWPTPRVASVVSSRATAAPASTSRARPGQLHHPPGFHAHAGHGVFINVSAARTTQEEERPRRRLHASLRRRRRDLEPLPGVQRQRHRCPQIMVKAVDDGRRGRARLCHQPQRAERGHHLQPRGHQERARDGAGQRPRRDHRHRQRRRPALLEGDATPASPTPTPCSSRTRAVRHGGGLRSPTPGDGVTARIPLRCAHPDHHLR